MFLLNKWFCRKNGFAEKNKCVAVRISTPYLLRGVSLAATHYFISFVCLFDSIFRFYC